jgi:CO/xanthine dehydrogenase Mo-binding subunit
MAATVPSLANAVAKLTGKRIRTLPLTGKAIQEA